MKFSSVLKLFSLKLLIINTTTENLMMEKLTPKSHCSYRSQTSLWVHKQLIGEHGGTR